MDKSYTSKTSMVVRSLDVEKDPFRPREDGEEILVVSSHIKVPLVRLCILLIVPGRILLLQ
jgi:hypothetical protein